MITSNRYSVLFVGLLLLTSIVLAATVTISYLIVPVLYLLMSLPLSVQFKILTATALFPLGIRGVLGLPSLAFFTLVAPLILLGLLLRKINLICKPRTKVTSLTWLGILILLAALVASYFRNPAGAKSLFGGIGGTYGLKQYFVSVMCIVTYFISYFVFRSRVINIYRFMKYIMIVSLILGIIRLLTYFGFFQVPFFLGSFHYLELEGSAQNFVIQSRRIGGMDLVAAFSVIPAFILFEAQKYKRLAAFGLFLGIAFLLLSGGRSSFAGIAAATLIGIVRLGSKRFFQLLVGLAIAYFALTQITFGSERSVAQSQLERILMYEGLAERETHRLEGFEQLLTAFKENPFFGKGISAIEMQMTAGIADFGGHGTYFSLIGIFGLAGIAFLVLFIFSPVFAGLKRILRIFYIRALPKDILCSIRFATLTMIWMLFLFGAGGNGYSSSYLYLFIGMLTAQLDNAKQYMTRLMGVNTISNN